jgi:hypothetical protein
MPKIKTLIISYTQEIERNVPETVMWATKAAFWERPYEDGRGNKIDAIKAFRLGMNAEFESASHPLWCGLGKAKEVVEWAIEKGLLDKEA